MKNNKIKPKKGMTLIEVIISVTLLSILLIPISGIVISSLKNSKDGEYKQKATYIGQKVIEELKAYDNLVLKTEGSERYFELLDGDKIKEETPEKKFTGNFERTIFGAVDEEKHPKETKFKVEVEIEKNSKFNLEAINNIDEENARYKIILEKNSGAYKVTARGTAQELIISGDLAFDVKANELLVYENSNEAEKISIPATEGKNNSLIIILKDTDNNLNIDVINNLSEVIETTLIKENSTKNISLNSVKGKLLLTEIDKSNKVDIANMYTYKVVVKDSSGKSLFEGNSSSNIVIKK